MRFLAVGPGLGHQLLDRLAHFQRAWRCAAWGAPKFNRDRIWDSPWGAWSRNGPFSKTEDAAPDTIERDRNNRRLDIAHDSFKIRARKGSNCPVRVDLALGKNAHGPSPFRIASLAVRKDCSIFPRTQFR